MVKVGFEQRVREGSKRASASRRCAGASSVSRAAKAGIPETEADTAFN